MKKYKKVIVLIKKLFIICVFLSLFFSKISMASSEYTLDEQLSRADNMLLFNPTASLYLVDNHFFKSQKQSFNSLLVFDDTGKEITDYYLRGQLIAARASLELNDYKRAKATLLQLQKYKLSPILKGFVDYLTIQLGWLEHAEPTTLSKLSQLLDQLKDEQHAVGFDKMPDSQYSSRLLLQIYLLQLDIYSKKNDKASFEITWQQINTTLEKINVPTQYIRFLLTFAQYQIQTHYDNAALSTLLHAYWLSIENGLDLQLALTNQALGVYYFNHSIFDKALVHANAAASYYQSHHYVRSLNDVTLLLAKIHQKTGATEMALNNYINLLSDPIHYRQDSYKRTYVYQSIVSLYLDQRNAQQALFYLHYLSQLDATAFLINKSVLLDIFYARVALLQQKAPRVIQLLQPLLMHLSAIKGNKIDDNNNTISWLRLRDASSLYQQLLETLTNAYVIQENYKQAWQTNLLLRQLRQEKREQKIIEAQKYFGQYENLVEANLQINHFTQNRNDHLRQLKLAQKINLVFCFILIILIILFLTHRSITKQYIKMVQTLKLRLIIHPHSGLRNLLPFYFSNQQIDTNEFLIESPLTDKLMFMLIRFPFISQCYRHCGYQKGVAIEAAFGIFINDNLTQQERFYQYNEDQFLLITSQQIAETEVASFIERWQSILRQFIQTQQNSNDHANNMIYMAIVHYPLIPKAYSAINEQQLIDLLLMLCNQAQVIAEYPESSDKRCSWIYIKTIKTAPVASFSSSNIRQACLLAINNGLVKVLSSVSVIDWQNQHIE